MEPYFSEIAAFDQIGKLQEDFFFSPCISCNSKVFSLKSS